MLYWLQDEKGENIIKSTGYYVPSILAIDDNGYGDYVIMYIDENGFIKNWKFSMDDFVNEED